MKNFVTHINLWALWAVKVLKPSIAEMLKYLCNYFETGVGYGAINAVRCVYTCRT